MAFIQRQLDDPALGVFDEIVDLPVECLPLARFGTGTGIALEGNIVALLADGSPAKAAGLRIGDKILEAQGKSSNLQQALRQESDQQMVISVERFDSGIPETITFTTTTFEGRYRSPAMHSVMEDRQERIWVGVTNGRVLLSEDSGDRWRTWSKDDGLVVGKRPRAMQSIDDTIWIVSNERNGGLCRFDGSSWVREKILKLESSDFDADIAQTVDGSVWVSGLNRLQIWQHDEWETYDTRDLQIPGENHHMFVASDDSLWIAGIGRYPIRVAISPHEFTSVDELTYECTESSGKQWFIDKDTSRIVSYDGANAIAYGAADNAIDTPTGIVPVPDVGVVALGNHKGVASVATFDGNVWKRVDFPKLARDLSRKGVTVARDGRVWIATKGNRHSPDGGVFVGIGDDWQQLALPDVPSHASSIMELPDGRMMFAGGYGVMTFDGATWLKDNDELIRDTRCDDGVVDAEGTVWVATRKQGVLRYQDNRWTAFTTEDGLLGNEVATIAVAAPDDVWASTTDGLCRFDGSRFYRSELPGHFGRRSIKAGIGGSIWFDRSHRYVPDSTAPTASLEEQSVELNANSDALVRWHGVDAWNRTAADALSWSYRTNSGDWSTFRHENHAVLKGLKLRGQHTVEVRSRDSDFNVSEVSSPLSITVLPPFWMRTWFFVTTTGLLSLLIWQSISLIRRGIVIRRSNTQLANAKLQLSEAFAEKSAQFRAICDCSPIGIFVTDTAGQLTYMNHQLERSTGRSTKDSLGNGWANAIHPDDRERFLISWKHAIDKNEPFQASGRFVHSDGTIIWFDVGADKIVSDGELIGFVGAVEDVTQRILASEDIKESNAQLRQALDQLQQAQDQAIKRERLSALGQMAAGVAHDINNSLAPLMNYSELLANEESVRGPARQWIELIRLGVSDTAGIVKRLDHFYRESHNREFLEPFSLAEVVTQAVDLTRPRWKDAASAEGKTIDVRVETVSTPIVEGHPAQIRAVLTNLIFNAVDAISHQGTVTIRIDESYGHAVVEVSDDGSGMTGEQIDRCLEPFYTSKTSGSGLGLSECHGVIRQHGGHIEIESELAQGTLMRVLLPLANRQPDDVDAAIANDKSGGSLQVDTDSDSTRGGVLYIDDDPSVRGSTTALLNSLGIAVETADDGPAGLARLERSQFELVMCDQGLPGMNGIDVLNEIKRRWPDLPVVMVSGWSLPDLRDGAQPDGFLKKPFSFDELQQQLERYLPSVNEVQKIK